MKFSVQLSFDGQQGMKKKKFQNNLYLSQNLSKRVKSFYYAKVSLAEFKIKPL